MTKLPSDLHSRTTPHNSPLRARYRVSFVSHKKKIDRGVWRAHCICLISDCTLSRDWTSHKFRIFSNRTHWANFRYRIVTQTRIFYITAMESLWHSLLLILKRQWPLSYHHISLPQFYFNTPPDAKPVWDDVLTPTIFWPRGQNIVTIYWPPLRYFDPPIVINEKVIFFLYIYLIKYVIIINIILINF